MIKFFKQYNEFLLGPVALLLWIISPWLFHQVDETAATYDVAVFQKHIFGLITFSVTSLSTWFVLRLTFPKIFTYLTSHFDNDFEQLNEDKQCTKLKISFAVFALYLLALLLAMQVL